MVLKGADSGQQSDSPPRSGARAADGGVDVTIHALSSLYTAEPGDPSSHARGSQRALASLRLRQTKARVTSSFGDILKMDSTKKASFDNNRMKYSPTLSLAP